MKKVLTILLVMVMLLSLTACGGSKKATGNEFPNVFGIDYNDAISVLEADGFEVKAIETDVAGISEKLLYPLEKVSKGSVVKVDDYIIDNLGHITKNYDILWDDEAVLLSDDMSVVIYYAKEDYALVEKDEPVQDTPTTVEPTPEETTPPTTAPQATEKTETLGSDFKAAMDSYEKFMSEYVEFMKKFNNNPSDLTLLADYADFMSDYAEYVESFEKWEDEDLNSAELAYYAEVQSRITKKLLEIA